MDRQPEKPRTVTPPEDLSFGARLKLTRESMHLTREEVAARLRLNPSMIQLLEAGNYRQAPPATFTRGYLRAYARLLNFDDQKIDSALDASDIPIQTGRSFIAPAQQANLLSRADRYTHWLTGTALVCFGVLTAFLWQQDRLSLPHFSVPLSLHHTKAQVPPSPKPEMATTEKLSPPIAIVVPTVPVILPEPDALARITAPRPTKPKPTLTAKFSPPTEPGLDDSE